MLLLQARVLAARDHTGAVPLLEGRTAAGSLIIACGTFLPEGVHQMVDIQPGGRGSEAAGSARRLFVSLHLFMTSSLWVLTRTSVSQAPQDLG